MESRPQRRMVARRIDGFRWSGWYERLLVRHAQPILRTASTYPPDVSCSETFMLAQREAREAGAGLWGAEPTSEAAGTDGIVITYIFYDGIEGREEPDEYVEIRNDGSSAVNLSG